MKRVLWWATQIIDGAGFACPAVVCWACLVWYLYQTSY